MKQEMKLMLTAVLTVFASCSSDELETRNSNQQPSKGGLTVQVENLLTENSQSRSAYNPTGNKLTWQKGDMLNVYDEELTTYDEYGFSTTDKAFTPNRKESDIDGTISYALFPAQQVDYAGWTSKGNRAVINLPTTIVYNEDFEDVSNGTTIYYSRLPMWGTATGNFGNVHVDLKYLSGVMKVKIDRSKATFVKIASAVKPLSGGFEAVIAKDGVTEAEPIVQQGGKSLGTQKYIIIDLRQMTSEKGYVYVPVIPDTYDDLTVSYTDLEVESGKDLTKAQIADKEEAIWKNLKIYPAGKQIKRGTAYAVNM